MFRPAALALAALWVAAAGAQQPSPQRCESPPTQEAKLLPLPRVIALAVKENGGGRLLSVDYDACERVYQVKLIKGGIVTMTYIDAAKGDVVGKVGG